MSPFIIVIILILLALILDFISNAPYYREQRSKVDEYDNLISEEVKGLNRQEVILKHFCAMLKLQYVRRCITFWLVVIALFITILIEMRYTIKSF